MASIQTFAAPFPSRFEKGIKAMPLQSTASAPPARLDPRVYIPPPLCKKAAGWNP